MNIIKQAAGGGLEQVREEDLEDMFHILTSVTAPALCAALSHADPQIAWNRLQAQLDILRRGMEARHEPAPSHHE